MTTLAERAKRIGEKAAEQPIQPRDWYRIKRPTGEQFDVCFNPPQTLPEARERYPDCDVSPA